MLLSAYWRHRRPSTTVPSLKMFAPNSSVISVNHWGLSLRTVTFVLAAVLLFQNEQFLGREIRRPPSPFPKWRPRHSRRSDRIHPSGATTSQHQLHDGSVHRIRASDRRHAGRFTASVAHLVCYSRYVRRFMLPSLAAWRQLLRLIRLVTALRQYCCMVSAGNAAVILVPKSGLTTQPRKIILHAISTAITTTTDITTNSDNNKQNNFHAYLH